MRCALRHASTDLAGLNAMAAALPPRWRERLTMRGQPAALEPSQAVQADGLADALGDGTLLRLSIGYTGYIPRVLRSHIGHADGTPRETVAVSIIDTEWAGLKRHLQPRLEANA